MHSFPGFYIGTQGEYNQSTGLFDLHSLKSGKGSEIPPRNDLGFPYL